MLKEAPCRLRRGSKEAGSRPLSTGATSVTARSIVQITTRVISMPVRKALPVFVALNAQADPPHRRGFATVSLQGVLKGVQSRVM